MGRRRRRARTGRALGLAGAAVGLAGLGLVLAAWAWARSPPRELPEEMPGALELLAPAVGRSPQGWFQHHLDQGETRRERRSASRGKKPRQKPVAAHYKVKLPKDSAGINSGPNGTIRGWEETLNATRPLNYNPASGEFSVLQKGLYYLYCQVHFNEGRTVYIKLDVLVDGVLALRCLEQFPPTSAGPQDPELRVCQVSGLLLLQKQSVLRLRTLRDVRLKAEPYLTFFGLFQAHLGALRGELTQLRGELVAARRGETQRSARRRKQPAHLGKPHLAERNVQSDPVTAGLGGEGGARTPGFSPWIWEGSGGWWVRAGGLGARTPGFSPQLWEGSGGWWLEQEGWKPGLLGSLPALGGEWGLGPGELDPTQAAGVQAPLVWRRGKRGSEGSPRQQDQWQQHRKRSVLHLAPSHRSTNNEGDMTEIWWKPFLQQGRALEVSGPDVTVKQTGLYLVYSQVLFHDPTFTMGQVLWRASAGGPGQILLRCVQSMPREPEQAYNSCYSGGVFQLQRGDQLSLRVPRANASLDLSPHGTFLGLVRL
ncbi:uncharacterized protein LOC127039751 [Gopherus flavomarginatus]|uniref:uncharacterized protein LOC127039751 n=1 Tax=Gopherus flavomarginatus TaxID=286002 RepID=UPI0021CC1683|nr:uncharacterized protein LOC127039751 [Gopherus flavomarginatus]